MKVIVIMPAYNAAETLERTYTDIPLEIVDEIILGDDMSRNETVEIAGQLGLQTIVHVQNKAYSGNQNMSNYHWSDIAAMPKVKI